jgi:hypothetical protein
MKAIHTVSSHLWGRSFGKAKYSVFEKVREIKEIARARRKYLSLRLAAKTSR